MAKMSTPKDIKKGCEVIITGGNLKYIGETDMVEEIYEEKGRKNPASVLLKNYGLYNIENVEKN